MAKTNDALLMEAVGKLTEINLKLVDMIQALDKKVDDLTTEMQETNEKLLNLSLPGDDLEDWLARIDR